MTSSVGAGVTETYSLFLSSLVEVEETNAVKEEELVNYASVNDSIISGSLLLW